MRNPIVCFLFSFFISPVKFLLSEKEKEKKTGRSRVESKASSYFSFLSLAHSLSSNLLVRLHLLHTTARALSRASAQSAPHAPCARSWERCVPKKALSSSKSRESAD